MPFKNRIRLPLYIKQPQFPAEANRFRLANGASKTLSVVIRKTYNLVTDYMPERMHQRVTIALNHDEVNIEGDRYVGGVSVDGEYKIEWPDFLDYPLGQAEVQIQVTPFAATNDNCQTCEEVTQIALVDDTIPDPIDEGDDGTIAAFENDSICCFPVTAEIITFNTTYVDAATIDDEGNAVITIKNPSPSGTNVLLATYRVTCPNGGYDEANIYGTVVGTDPVCETPLFDVYNFIDDDSVQIDFLHPGATDYAWQLYESDNLGTPVQTGTVAGLTIAINGLTPGQEYVISIVANCDGTLSESGTDGFTMPAPDTNCGEFILANQGHPDPIPFDDVTYMNCAGVLTNTTVVGEKVVCMLTDGSNVPLYFQSENDVTIYTYQGPC